MPFLADKKTLFLCLADYDFDPKFGRVWKAHFISEKHNHPVRLNTGFSDLTCECGPTGWEDERGWHVSLIAGGDPSNPKFNLYLMEGKTLETLGRPIPVSEYVMSGFKNKEETIVVKKTAFDGDFLEIPSIGLKMNVLEILRVSYQADDLSKYLISYNNAPNDLYTVRYDAKTKKAERITCDGNPAYKFTVFGDKIIYAKKLDQGFENRQLVEAQSVVYTPLENWS
jgi:hypothetical protein